MSLTHINRLNIFLFLPLQVGVGYCICCLSLILGIIPSLKGSYLLPDSLINWNINLIFQAHVAHSKFMFFLSNTSFPIGNFNANGTDQSLDDLEIISGIGHILVYTMRYLGAYFIDLFMIMSSVTLWLATRSFIQTAMNLNANLPRCAGK